MMRVRTVSTASGSKAIQVIYYLNRKRIIFKHIGSARTDSELDSLQTVARDFIDNYSPEQPFKEEISIYPNPVTKDVLNVVPGIETIKSISLINLSGVKVISIPKVNNPKQVVLNTSGLVKGVYLLEITNAQSTTVKKVVID